MQRYFQSYARMIAAGDITAIERHFAYPCLITNQGGVDVIHDADELAQHLEGFLVHLKRQGVTHARVRVQEDRQFGTAQRTAAVHFRLEDGAGRAVEEFDYLYVLVGNGAGGWKIRLANLIGPI